MPKRSKIATLPPQVKAWLDQALVEGNFAGYQQLEAEIKSRGYAIGKSSIHRYGTDLERRLQAIRASTEAASAIAKAAPDDADLRSAAVISLVQTETFDIMVRLRELDVEKDAAKRLKLLSGVATSIAKLSNASVRQKKHELEVRAKVAAVVDELVQAQGMSDEQARYWREKFLGITHTGSNA